MVTASSQDFMCTKDNAHKETGHLLKTQCFGQYMRGDCYFDLAKHSTIGRIFPTEVREMGVLKLR